MKALSTLKSAIDQSYLGIMALVLLTPVLFPKLAFAAELQTQGQSAQIFEIKVTDSSLLGSTPKPNDNKNSLSINEITQSDPLTVSLHDYLASHSSPLADYTAELLEHDNWKTVIAISQVESNMCVHNLRFNCSGIGGPGHFYAFKNFGGWIDCMSNLLTTRYEGKTLDQMNGVYVQPKSVNWAYGSKKIYAELASLEQDANEQRITTAQANINIETANLELATIAE
jgi:hypothetical protein